MTKTENALTLVRSLPENASELSGLEVTLSQIRNDDTDNGATIRRPDNGMFANAATLVRQEPPDNDNAATVVRPAEKIAFADENSATIVRDGATQTEAFRDTVLRPASATADGAARESVREISAGRSGVNFTGRSQSISLRTGASAISINVHSRNISTAPGSGAQAAGNSAGIGSDYELQEKLGEGGMGVVYTARQSSIDRQIALKMMKGSATDSARAKFLQEAVVTGDLDHPNIVTIHDLGTDAAGNIFYAMKKISGTGWNKVIGRKSRQENLDILLKVCDAVAFAHARGIIHRDLKPENVMLGAFGEVVVMDWGLALAVNDNGKAERANAGLGISGTPAYLAPEMAVPGRWREVGTVSDIYLLGAILYEILTGDRPHEGKNVRECLRNAARNLIKETPLKSELLEIALHAMATRPAERFPCVQDFQIAIREYQAHAEAILIAAKAREQLQRAAQTRQYEDFASAVYRFRQARELWDGNGSTLEGLKSAVGQYAELALQNGDLDLARSLVEQDNFVENSSLHGKIIAAMQTRENAQRRARFFRRAAVTLTAAVVLISVGAALWINSARRRETRALKAMLDAQRQEAWERQAKVAAQKEARESKEEIRQREELSANTWWAFDREKARKRQTEAARQEKLPAVLTLGKGQGAITMRLIPAGFFAMGSPLNETGRLSEENLHRVQISQVFYLAQYELTVGQVRAWGLKTSPVPQNLGLPEAERNSPDMPQAGLSFDTVRAKIIPALTKFAPPPSGWHYALPTEAQWEWACRAGTNTAYANGSDAFSMKEIGVSGGENRLYAAPAGRKIPNAWGLYDMHGNLAEWCADAYEKNAYFQEPVIATDPFVFGVKTAKRVVRGGSWANLEEHCRSAYRSFATASGNYRFIGARLALVRD